MIGLILLLVLIAFSCKKKNGLINHTHMCQEWEFKMISSGDNRPNFRPTGDSIHYIPILLNEGYQLEDIKAHFNWTELGFEKKIKTLLESDFLKKDADGIVKSNVLIFSLYDSENIKEAILPLVKDITQSIVVKYKDIVAETAQVDCLKEFEFEEISLFMLSNILLDNGQIENVEQEYLNSERPLRGGKRYYAAYLGKENGSHHESFNIYGNQVENHEGFAICRYGNQRQLPEVIETNAILKNQFQGSMSTQMHIPILSWPCNEAISVIADNFKPELLGLLKKYDQTLRGGYTEFGYDAQVSYEEYFIWLYHVIYTEVTDSLIDKKLITLPEERVSFYILDFMR